MNQNKLVFTVLICILVAMSSFASGPNKELDTRLSKKQFLYNYSDMINFDIREFLTSKAPHLLPYSEAISHYAGYSTINPKLLISLMHHQTQILESNKADSKIQKPFGILSNKTGFNEQLSDISQRLSQDFYRGHAFSETGLNHKETSDKDVRKALKSLFKNQNYKDFSDDMISNEIISITKIYNVLFESQLLDKEVVSTSKIKTPLGFENQPKIDTDIDKYFQLPFPVDDKWTFGGSHTNTGSGSYPQSSLDLNRGGYWGDNLSHIFVSAAAPGRAIIHSSCFMEIIHDSNWSTTYYHLSGIQAEHNAQVTRNDKIANYANNINQALCNGGQSSGPHVHFSLKQDGQFYHLNGMSFSGYKVETGRNSYDTNCNYFWLERNGDKNCAWSWINNPGIDEDDNEEPHIWPMENGQVRWNIYGHKGVYYYYKISVPEGASNLNFRSYSGSGDADMYVRFGELPSESAYLCRPDKGDNNETCTFESPSSGDWFIMLHGYKAFNGLSLKTTYSD